MEIENVKMQTGKKLRGQVTVWLKSVEKVTKEVHEIEFKSREAMGCCKGCFPNCFLRLKLSKQAAKKIEAVSELLQKGRFTDGLFVNLPESRMTLPTSTLLGGTAEKTKEKIWECLMDVNVAVLGVYGIGGVGKTTIMTHIYNQLIEDSIFYSVIWVTVSKASTLEQLQNNIAKSLDLELSKEADEMRRSQELFAAFKRRKKFVLILDDMWIAFPLEKKLPMLAKLKALRMLDLYYTPIEELPQGMEALTNLRCLNLSWTYKLQSLPAGVFLELSNLEDLRMYGNQWRWSSNTVTGGARIEEFKSLRRLANLSTHIADLPSFLSFVNSRNSQCLKTFHLMVDNTRVLGELTTNSVFSVVALVYGRHPVEGRDTTGRKNVLRANELSAGNASTTPTDVATKKLADNDSKAQNALYSGLVDSKLVKVMTCKIAKEI
ncbi:hypothetical protein MRB53_015413 [Persea americana]|uniref:Uncharacterized protein n=1 Tax=Persea americana TaxID=3435 RepID=A0ACC2KDL7_PERAE|nr:hypothetical protein MRB53_015413 [Persea americana]